MAVRTRWVFALLTIFVLSGVGLVAIGIWLSGKHVELKSGSTLVLDLSEEVLEDRPADSRTQFFYEDHATLWEIVSAVRHAATDDRIEAVLVKDRGIDWGWGKLEELRLALATCQDSGKRVITWMEGGDERDYYLASVGDDVFLPPSTFLMVDGFAVYASFLKGTLDAVGVQANLEHVGEYKDAGEPLTRKNMSEPSREALTAVLDDEYGTFLATVAEARGWTPEEARQKVDQGPYLSEEALSAGLVDSLLYEADLDGFLPGGESGPRIELDDYLDHVHFGTPTSPRIGLVFASGTIMPGKSGFDPLWGRTLGHETLAKALKDAREDDKVKAVVLRVDSPGGDTYASNVMWREVKKTAAVKPVIASFSDVAASGGYYLAMGADSLVAQPGTLTGSIGVLGGKFNLAGLYAKLGMTVEVISRGENAQFFSPVRNFTPAEREKYLAQLWEDYRQFVGIVAENRRQPEEEVEQLARGRVWTGGQAFERGLVDTLGGFETAISLARRCAGVADDEDVRYVVYPKVQRSFFNRVLNQILNEPDVRGAALRLPGVETLRSVARLAGRPSLAWMPWEIEVR
jgi:protease-4